MNKSELRKRIFKIRKKSFSNEIQIDISSIIKILRKNRYNKKNVGGYYAYNYEIDIISVLKKFEEMNYSISLPKIGKNSGMNFFKCQISLVSRNQFQKNYPDILLVLVADKYSG